MIIGSLTSLAVGKAFGTSWNSVEVGIFAVDVVALLALIQLTLKSDRFWPMWATAFQLLAVAVHTAMMVVPDVTPWAFGTGAVFWAYPMLLALAIGSFEHRPFAPDRETGSG
jgi:urea transporter